MENTMAHNRILLFALMVIAVIMLSSCTAGLKVETQPGNGSQTAIIGQSEENGTQTEVANKPEDNSSQTVEIKQPKEDSAPAEEATQPKEAIIWREPKLEALVRAKIAKPTGDVYQSDLEYFWGIELFGESHIFFNASGGYRMPLSPDSYNAPYNPDVIDNPDSIIFHLDYNHIRFT